MNYVGMDIYAAKADALQNGRQLRIMSYNGLAHRHAGSPDPRHILVWVTNDKVTKQVVASEYNSV